MSLASLSSKIYTIKSRRNVSLSTAFTSMIREDLAMRYSVFNIVKSLTGSEMIATIAESKYGKKTPLQKEEDAREKRKATLEKRFKQFTADSLVSLNNKINTLSSITERNTVLIENLYNDLGSFRNQRRFTKRDMNTPYTRTPLRSRTVKFQIDQIRNELNALQAVTLGRNGAKKIKRAAAGFGGATTGAAVGAGAGAGAGQPTSPGTQPTPPGTTEEKGLLGTLGDLAGTALDLYSGYQIVKAGKTGVRYIRRKFFPTSAPTSPSAVPVRPTPTATPSAKTPVWNEGAQRWQDPQSGKFVKPPPSPAAGGTPGATTAPKVSTATRLLRAGSFARNFLKGSIIGEAAWQAGPGMLNRLTGFMQKSLVEKRADAINAVSKYGIKFITGPGGTTVGFIIDGKKFDRLQDLPIEFQNLINAYAMGDTRSYASRAALAAIKENPEKYKSLLTADGRAIVLSPPPEPPPVPAAAVAAAAAAVPPAPTTPVAAPTAQSTPTPAPSVEPPPKAPPTLADGITQIGNVVRIGDEVKTGGTVAWRTNNPGNVSWGGLAKKFGAIGRWMNPNGDEQQRKVGIAIMPTLDAGYDLMKSLWKRPMYENLTIAQGAHMWTKGKIKDANGNMFAADWYGKGLAAAAGVPVDTPISQLTDAQLLSMVKKQSSQEGFKVGMVMRSPVSETETRVASLLSEGMPSTPTVVRTAAMAPTSTSPLMAGIPGATVATPPPVPTASGSATEPSSAEVAGRAALAVTQTTQSTVVALAGKVSEIDKKTQLDREFPSVRNASAVA